MYEGFERHPKYEFLIIAPVAYCTIPPFLPEHEQAHEPINLIISHFLLVSFLVIWEEAWEEYRNPRCTAFLWRFLLHIEGYSPHVCMNVLVQMSLNNYVLQYTRWAPSWC